jgi:antibiotic biosynthesis monooxygenase
MTVPEGRIRSILLLQPRNNDYAALLAFFREHDILGLAIREAGAHSGEVHVPLSGTGPVVVMALWDSAEAYAGWRNHPVRDRFAPDMERLTQREVEPITGGLYTVAIAAG